MEKNCGAVPASHTLQRGGGGHKQNKTPPKGSVGMTPFFRSGPFI